MSKSSFNFRAVLSQASKRAIYFARAVLLPMQLILVIALGPEISAAEPDISKEAVPSASGPKIRSITVEVLDVFDEPDLGWVYRSANKIKVNTREKIIRRELLFAEGDVYDSFLIQESERNLRSLPFIRRITITPIEHGGAVDIKVSVQDTWTLIPQLSFSSGGGTKRSEIGIAEGNLLGQGKRLEMFYADDEGREKIEGVWDDPRLFGSQQQLVMGVFKRSDGFRTVNSIGRPFRTLVEPYAWEVNTDIFDLVGRLFEDSEESFIFRERHEAASAGYTIVDGDPQKLLYGYTFGYFYSSDEFEMPDEQDYEDVNVNPDDILEDPSLLAADRKFSGPMFALRRIKPDFISLNYVDRFERIEDFNLGNEFGMRVVAAPEWLDSNENTALFNISDNDGWRISPTSFIRGEIMAESRAADGGMDNSIIGSQVKYYNVLGHTDVGNFYIGRHTLAGGLRVDYSHNLDLDKQLTLGAGSGLRGYKDRTFTGSSRVLLNLEDRFHMVDDVLKFISVGGVVFADVGGTSDAGVGEIITDHLYSDVGFGFRFGFPRSSGGSVARLDFAFPLRDGPDGSKQFEPRILFSTGQAFNARLQSESLGVRGRDVKAGAE